MAPRTAIEAPHPTRSVVTTTRRLTTPSPIGARPYAVRNRFAWNDRELLTFSDPKKTFEFVSSTAHHGASLGTVRVIEKDESGVPVPIFVQQAEVGRSRWSRQTMRVLSGTASSAVFTHLANDFKDTSTAFTSWFGAVAINSVGGIAEGTGANCSSPECSIDAVCAAGSMGGNSTSRTGPANRSIDFETGVNCRQ
jgi:hypothetical protein